MRRLRGVRRYGDAALICETDDFREAHLLARSIEQLEWQGVEEVVVGERSLTLVADPDVLDRDDVTREMSRIHPEPAANLEAREHVMRVTFDGPDLEDVAIRSGLGTRRLVDELTNARFEVAFLGFAPGFAYMVGLPPQLAALARRSTPRAAVPRGSVAIGGGFAAVYPQRSPGGWHLLGRTDARLFDPRVPPFAVLSPGDHVRLREGDVGEPEHEGGREPLRARGARRIEVLHPGLFSLVEDLGRVGVAALGVPRSGAADPTALRLSNQLVGNDEISAAIEVNGQGPTLRADCETHVAVVGDVAADIDGTRVPLDTPIAIGTGQVLHVGRTGSVPRAYVAFGGGVDLPQILGSRSSDTLSHIGPGPLRRGDVLDLGNPVRPKGRLLGTVSSFARRPMRVLAGPDVFEEGALERLVATDWEISPESDRVGVRLKGGSIRPPSAGIASRATVTGAIQVPPDGTPIALMCDHATVGGYPVIATVIRADLGLLGQLGAGNAVRFELVDLPAAKEALRVSERDLQQQVSGWYPVRAD